MQVSNHKKVKSMRYIRDMRGFGANPPKVSWPDNSKIAVQFVVNYEEGGENCILHGDPGSEAFLSEIVGASAWPKQRHWNMESIYEYGARAGFWRLHNLFKEQSIPVTVFGVASALARSPEQVAAMKSENWEIACHGLKWVEHKDMPFKEERLQIKEAIKLHREITGELPRGWYTGRCSENTVFLASEIGHFLYISDSYADDLPYWINVGHKKQLIVPYTLDTNDMRFATPQGFNTSNQFLSYLKDSFDTLYNEGKKGQPKMMSIGLHCRLIGRPGRVKALEHFIEYTKSHKDVWFAKRVDIAEHWHSNHPYLESELPSKMSKNRFVDLYGNIFENSDWIAKAAYELELGPAHDCAAGIHSVLSRVFRSASQEQRLSVLRSHPDLAGKMAQSRGLTDTSKDEQMSAGLDNLNVQEQKQFEKLNKAYIQKHGFPFIIAVRDHTKESILEIFEKRIENEKNKEFFNACKEVERIAEIRLMDIF